MGTLHFLQETPMIPELAFGIRLKESKQTLSTGHIFFPKDSHPFYVLYWRAATGTLRATSQVSSLYDFFEENPEYEFFWGDTIVYGV